ncbi:nuclear transport factor 2 family protein [Yeosuana sp. MJ-SS3]|uniref:Nuclear transport factor 2 family protein n=1 Tax=Gilvirhabdus luticola TaxID=3079858 RepID=A0ABU3U766_9FLAO|nr:nuclear transport factor 2 family protein [Yeosuana sp. MJ-SS3]MDU8886253.1 nuclear transport factor 2 family protein [Yeosuana sp. MJ-SS3]
MTRIIAFLIVFISVTSYSQESEEAKVKLVVDTFFQGFHKGDTILLKSVLIDKILMQTAYKNKEGEDILITDEPNKLINAIANRPGNEKWEEKLLSYNIQIDGNLASVWTPYEFWFNGEFHHCGVNSFQLFKEGKTWKIIYLIDTRRRSDCN